MNKFYFVVVGDFPLFVAVYCCFDFFLQQNFKTTKHKL